MFTKMKTNTVLKYQMCKTKRWHARGVALACCFDFTRKGLPVDERVFDFA